MREQENGWEPLGPVDGDAGAGRARRVRQDRRLGLRRLEQHALHPARPGGLLAAGAAGWPSPSRPRRQAHPDAEGGGDRNSIPIYSLPSARVIYHFIPEMPLRVSAMRGVGRLHERLLHREFMDELALAAGADPVAFRLRHPGRPPRPRRDNPRRRGFRLGQDQASPWPRLRLAFARYKNLAAYCAVAAEVSVEHETGRTRLVRRGGGGCGAGGEPGRADKPGRGRHPAIGKLDAVRERHLRRDGRHQPRLSGYPIMRSMPVPDSVEVQLVDRPGLPFLGAGECGQGPAAAAIANALAAATGQRLRNLR